MRSVTLATSEALVAAAVRAPSSHNTQPWLFRCAGDAIELYADRSRALPVNDPFDRELTISCGAALFNLRVAAGAAGLTPHVQLLPVSDDGDLLATVTLRAGGPTGDVELADAIALRRTNRGAFRPDLPPEHVVRALGLSGQPQLVVRLGIPLEVPPAGSRRPVHEVIEPPPADRLRATQEESA